MSSVTTLVEIPLDKRLDQISPERCARGNLYACEDVSRRQVLLIAQKISNLKAGIEELFPSETPAESSLFDASANKHRKGKTGAWAVHRLEPEEVRPFLAERRKFFTRTVIAATNPSAWRLEPVV